MLRELQTYFMKNIDAMYKAASDMVVGTPVVKDYEAKTVDTAPDKTVAGFFFARKERIPTGCYCGVGDMSDYHDNFMNIKAGEGVTLIPPVFGERYATELFDGAEELSVGDPLMVSGGKFKKADVESPLIYGGEFDDAGHKLYIIEVSNVNKSAE